MRIAPGTGSFAANIMQGYYAEKDRQRQAKLDEEQARQREQDHELRDLQIQGLRRDMGRQDRMQTADDAIRTNGKVGLTTTFVPGKKEGETEQQFQVGDKVFTDRDEANQYLKVQNSPINVAKRQYDMAVEQGVPELTAKYAQQHAQVYELTKRDLADQAMAAARRGPQALAAFYNDKILDGVQENITRGPKGEVIVGQYQGGKLVGEPQTFATPDDYAANHLAMFNSNPEGYLNNYHSDRLFRENQRQFGVTTGLKQQELDNTDAYHTGMLGIERGRNAILDKGTEAKEPTPLVFRIPNDPGHSMVYRRAGVGKPMTGERVQGVPASVQPTMAETVQQMRDLRNQQPGGSAAQPGWDVGDDGAMANFDAAAARRWGRGGQPQ